MNQLFKASRYRELLLLSSFFIVFGAGLFAYNHSLLQDHHRSDIILEMSEKIINKSQEMGFHFTYLANVKNIPEESIGRLKENQDSINGFLHDFRDGETNYYGEKIKIKFNEKENQQLQKIFNEWAPINQALDDYRNSRDKSQWLQLVQMIGYGLSPLENDWHQLRNGFLKEHKSTQNKLEAIQYFGLLTSILAFLLFILALNRLFKQDEKQNQIHGQIMDMMNALGDGLFIIDEDLILGSQYSKALPEILERKELSHLHLQVLLEKIIPKSEFEIVKSYLRQLFNPRVKEKLVLDLNPLDKIKVLLPNKNEERWLSFHFNRIYGQNKNHIKGLLVSVRNITKAVQLEERILAEQTQSHQQVELLTTVLRGDENVLNAFVRSASGTTERINTILRRPALRPTDYRVKIDDIFREIHSLKGEASAVELSSFVALAHQMEDKLKRLKEKTVIVGEDFLNITVDLDQVGALIEKTNFLIQRLSGVKFDNIDSLTSQIEQLTLNSAETFTQSFHRFAQQVAERQGKKVQVAFIGFDDYVLSEKQYESLRDIIIQMVRNAIVHGIEPPEVRLAQGKSEIGSITIELEGNADKQFTLNIHDDGKGIDVEALREKASHYPEFKNRNLAELPNREIYKLIFKSGLSTAENVGEDAGRGMGMEVIRERLVGLNGVISIDSEPHVFTRFMIRF